VLVLAGDIDRHATLVAQYFGNIPASPRRRRR
jgi:hypothetical protein